jgi:hypothetical protein
MKKIILFASASLLLAASFAQAGMYRWVDEKGEVHFSDKVPVVATRKAVSEINKNGDVKNTVDPEAEALAKLEFEANTVERERLEAIEKDKQEVIATQKKRDDYLLSTYENKGELMTSFITKIKLMKGNAAILEAQNIVLDKKLTILLDRKIATKNKANKESLESKIININNTIEQYKEALKQNEDERTVLSKNYKKDVKRYSELTQ